MRIILDNADVICNSMLEPTYYHKADSVEITDEELVLIITWFMDRDSEYYMSEFPRCLRELIELKRMKL